MSEELTLLPCPACGASDVVMRVDTRAYVFCTVCGMCGPCAPKVDTEYVASQWNILPRALTWTDEPPKVPGWYWCQDAEGEIRLRQLENFVGGPRLFVCGISKHIFPDELTGIQWAGPIPEPAEPRS